MAIGTLRRPIPPHSSTRSIPTDAPSRSVIFAFSPFAQRTFRPLNIVIIAVSVFLLLWPAMLNGYPLVFSDTGTYLTQAIEHHLGWDRPPFYSFAILPLHWRLSLWPVVAFQALLVVTVIRTTLRCFAPGSDETWLPATIALLCLCTGLPWFASQVMPDLFTGLLAMALSILVLVPERLSVRARNAVAFAAAGMIVVHQINLPLSVLLLVVLPPLRRFGGQVVPLGRGGIARLAAVPLAAAVCLVGVNYAGHHRIAVSSGGNVFLLARLVDDGSARDVLARECPRPDWKLCGQIGNLGHDTDDFLWSGHGPLASLGIREMAVEATPIVHETIRAEPFRVLGDMGLNTLRQFVDVGSGDGLQAWPAALDPVIAHHFPAAEYRRYRGALQTRNQLAVPPALRILNRLFFWLGLVGTAAGAAVLFRQRDPAAGLCVAVLVCLAANAFLTGALSGPHDRYQSRIAWLTLFAPIVAASTLASRTSPSAGPAERRRAASE